MSDASAEPLVTAVLPAFAAANGIAPEEARRLETVVAGLVGYTLDNAYPDDDFGELEVTLEAEADVVHVIVHDWGLPLTSAGGMFGPLPESLAALGAERGLLLNLGSYGKRLTADVPTRSIGDPSRHHVEAAPRVAKPQRRSCRGSASTVSVSLRRSSRAFRSD